MDSAQPAEHFATLAHETHAVRFGMWVFLASEVLLFAGMFALYAGYRVTYGDAFAEGVRHNDAVLGTLNTVVLLVSSFFVARAVDAAEDGRTRRAGTLTFATALLGVVFLAIKAHEYGAHFAQHIYPGADGALAASHGVQGTTFFFLVYYLMTGTHAVHVTVGVGLFGWLGWDLRRRGGEKVARRLDLTAMYWHLVDIIWVFLWPLFYLAGPGRS